jgi:hypothetical protein
MFDDDAADVEIGLSSNPHALNANKHDTLHQVPSVDRLSMLVAGKYPWGTGCSDIWDLS